MSPSPTSPADKRIPHRADEDFGEPDFCGPIDANSEPNHPVASLPTGSWLAVLGGGQLGLMFCQAAQRLGYRVAAVDPDPNAPIAAIADMMWTASYQDVEVLQALSELAQAATIEFENVPYAALAHLAMRMPVRPAADSIAIAQSRIQEKMFFARHGLPVAPFIVLRDDNDLSLPIPQYLFPGRLKTARLGYDGKGQCAVTAPDHVASAFRQLGNVSCVLEQQLQLTREISVLIARDAQGDIALWPIAENIHRDGILDVTIVPARISETVAQSAREHARKVVETMGYRGVLCIEFFIDAQDNLYLNEMAPRPHNSGHHTIESCVTSQFEQQARITAGLPLGDPSQKTPAVMLNLLGDLWFLDSSELREPDWNALLADSGAPHSPYLHLYGKKEARRGRKMGHITCCAAALDDALQTVCRLRKALRLPELESFR
ncbi:MAG: 5-(carboxyamino)imidazole ribonucleotide synthase [Burkholderiales bacterium]|jgi:5-(carboxyamino)imidazole ribonucleotide synthase|nr:5-(carboxyamino)imidazole ribonucleotide synthase [Burkholderiales bacterium]